MCGVFVYAGSRKESGRGLPTAEEERSLENFMRKGVAEGTRRRHDLRLDEWKRFLGTRGIFDPLLEGYGEEEKVGLASLFVFTMKDNWGFSANKVAECIRSVSFAFKTAGRDASWTASPTLVLAREACRGGCARDRNLEREARVRPPFTCDMYQWVRGTYWDEGEWGNCEQVDRAMVSIAVGLAFNFMWRPGEYIYGRGGHAIQTGDLELVLQGGRRLFPWEVREHNKVWVMDQVESALLVIRSSKTDREGRGRYLVLKRGNQSVTRLLVDLVRWCADSGGLEGEPLFSRWWDGRRKLLTSRMVTEVLREAGRAHGFGDLRVFTPHMLRVGGMTTMMAAEEDRGRVKRLGGWSSNSDRDLGYAWNTGGNEGVLGLMDRELARGVLLGAEEVRSVIRTQARRNGGGVGPTDPPAEPTVTSPGGGRAAVGSVARKR